MPNFDAERRIELQQLRNRLDEIRETIFSARRPLAKLCRCITGPGKGPERMPKSGWKPFQVMDRWGGLDQTTWFRMTAAVPRSFAGHRVVAILRPCSYTHIPGLCAHNESGEGLAYVNGKPFQGIDRNHDVMVLSENARGGERFDIAIECTPQTRYDATHVFACADLAIMHREAWDFYYDGKAYLDLVGALDPESATRRRLQQLLADTVNMVDLQHTGTPDYYTSLRRASRRLRRELAGFEKSHGKGAMTLIGQSHIDTAWLWPLRETQRKVGRTWSTVLRLMEQYPDFYFSASQAELYCFAKEHHPEIWREIKRRVKEGRWEICGAGWVEEDNNVPCGEALVRQFLYGNRFFEREFGVRSRTAWLPDSFGYPWSLPQILRKCGIETFFTIKIGWNQFTRFPFGYFEWQGADGSRITAVMPPMNYNIDPSPSNLLRQREAFQQKDLVDEEPFPYGFGDGGGGPTAEMIEYGRRYKDIAGLPKCTFDRTEACFVRMRAETAGKVLPVWNGELYLELHRGCQTTQSRTKRNNRRCEFLLHNAELLGSMALLHGGPYDQRSLLEAWRIVLTHQFHDILPGSSITEVYRDAETNYAAARGLIAKAWDSAAAYLLARINTAGPGAPIIVFNPLSWVRTEVVSVCINVPRGAFHVVGPDGNVVPSQRVDTEELLFLARGVPPLGYAVYRVVRGAAESPATELQATTAKLENDCLRVRLDAQGRFSSVYDKREQREALAPARKGNVLQLFDDRPAANDAWDIDHNFDNRQWEPDKTVSVKVIQNGPLRAVVRVVRRTEQSTFTQDITLCVGSPRIDVVTQVDWREKHTLLKVAFPVDVLSARATYHIQFATIERATHDNTECDRARFEAPAHHWADLSEGDYGVSLLNDCKYGYDVKGNTLRLSLLRSPVDPDPHADEGHHTFTYALYPHAGDWRNGTVQQGFELNQPLVALPAQSHTGSLPPVHAFAAIDADNVILDTVKKAEDGREIVVRAYEAYGQRGEASITFAHRPAAVAECDLMEEHDRPLLLRGNTMTFSITPYEIKTFKITYRPKP